MKISEGSVQKRTGKSHCPIQALPLIIWEKRIDRRMSFVSTFNYRERSKCRPPPFKKKNQADNMLIFCIHLYFINDNKNIK